jgi:hypothetical protein
MRLPTATSTKTLEAVGIKPRELLNPPQATREPTLQLLAAMAGRKGAVRLQLLVEVEVVGNPDKRALAVQPAEEGAVDENPCDTANEVNLNEQTRW